MLLRQIIDPELSYQIYLDIKDTRSESKRRKLEEVLRNAKYDPTGQVIKGIQQIRSHESNILQIADLLIGALRYKNENLSGSDAKLTLIRYIIECSKRQLIYSTWPKESKFNILIWKSGGGEQ